jgi:hypothetical protein
MTRKIEPGASAYGAEAATPGGVALQVISRKNEKLHRVLKLCGQIPDKSAQRPLLTANFPAKPQKTPQTFQSLWRMFDAGISIDIARRFGYTIYEKWCYR